ncbi:MAG: glycine cleavage system aminomethyltransferase GcvT [Acidobacteria bacterium]|nr:glycine cleavage system aminomethyltransferase GcvT [Acidobacteriota bacterium]
MTTELLKTALNATHRRMGAKMVPFGGWDMPVEYSGIIAEHMAVRTKAGLFDVSHMGRVDIEDGPQAGSAFALLQSITCNDVAKLQLGQAHYTALLNARAGIVDDILIHKISDRHYFLCINAARRAQDLAWIRVNNQHGARITNRSDETAQIALQGPRALAILQPFTKTDLAAIRYYWFTSGEVMGVPARIARTGYTGEDGFELYIPVAESERIWNGLLEAGKHEGLLPAGLGCRNTLRLESAMLLYGHDMDEATTPLESNLGWITKLDKGEFLGREVLQEQKAKGVAQQLVGFRMIDRGIARDDAPVWKDGQKIGKVTSGSHAPFLKQNIGLARVPSANAKPGERISIEIRGQMVAAEVVPTPFYKRSKN